MSSSSIKVIIEAALPQPKKPYLKDQIEVAGSEVRGAIDRLRAGQQLVRSGQAGMDFIEASVIDARLRELVLSRHPLADENTLLEEKAP